LFSAGRNFVTRVQESDAKEIERFYPGAATDDETDIAQAFLEFVEAEIDGNINPPSLLPLVIENFPIPPRCKPQVASLPVRLSEQECSIDVTSAAAWQRPQGRSNTVCHAILEIDTLNRPGRLCARIGQGDTGAGVMVRIGPNGPECSRPLVSTFGEVLDPYLATHTGPLVDNLKPVTDDDVPMVYWHRNLRGLLMLIVAAHQLPPHERWAVYLGILDHCTTHYPIPKSLSESLLHWIDKRFARIDFEKDIQLWSPDAQLELTGTLALVYFPDIPVVVDETVHVDLDV
jgi:hypothetical protein